MEAPRDAAYQLSLQECAEGMGSFRESYICHYCGKLFSCFSLFPHLRTCREKERLSQKKKCGGPPMPAPPDVPATPEWRREYNSWARDIVVHQRLLTPCHLCGQGVLQKRMSTHLWKCRVNSRETHASTEALARVLAAPFSPYEEKIRDLWPRLDQLKEDPARRGHPENSPPATVTPFKVSVFLTVIEALCRQEKSHTERETNREASKGCTAPRMPTNRHRPKSCSTAQQKQELKRRDLPPCLRYRCPRTEARRDSGRHTQSRQAVASRKDSLLCWQTRQAEAYLQWFHHCPHVAKKTEESGDASPERSRETDELRAREPEGWRGEEADFNIPFRTPGNEGNIDSLFFSLPSHTHL
ncbi:hypothetical protein TGRUB_289340 [Toxoplasma gondii RUB]|uniref:Uncharacterized protein n=1 Tax=Toxoplasma gondii RUB TaxID=935652 RepID=A0A086M1A6_TOXGO|nr:hypothetical protein TGRUB_289340 [Toxoplasma gondii RUB]